MSITDIEMKALAAALGYNKSIVDLRKDYYQAMLDGSLSAEGLTSDGVNTLLTGATSFASLRTRTPAKAGERVWVSGHTVAGKGMGWFRAVMATGVDDGGVTAAGSGFYWRREVDDLASLNVLHFGAVGDGVTDDGPACKRMLDFMTGATAIAMNAANTNPNLGIKFPPGKFYVSPQVFSRYGTVIPNGASDAAYNPSGYYAAGGISILGATTINGKQILTTIVSDKSTSPVFYLNHRRLTVHGITWDGQQTTLQNEYNADSNPTGTNMLVGATKGVFNDTASNKQPFLYNECPGGEYLNVSCFAANNTGSYAIYVLDTLDSHIEQVFSLKTAGPVIQVGWSNRPAGVWDHSTSVEINNCNFQYCYSPAVWIPRHGQGIMRNVWFEHGVCPFDLNNGQWLMDMICVESCTTNPTLWNGRQQIRTFSGPTGNAPDTTTTPSGGSWNSYPTNPDGSAVIAWVGGYEVGSTRFETHTTQFNNPTIPFWQSGVIRGTNNTASSIWLNIGSFRTPATGGSWEIEIICRNGYATIGSGNYPVTADRTPGKTIINIQRGSGTVPTCNVYHYGNTGVLAAQYQDQPTGTNDVIPAVWVNLSSYCGEYVVNIKGTGVTRMDAGNCSLYGKSGLVQAASPAVNAITARMSLHNGSAGVGAQGTLLAVSSATGTPTTTATPAGYIQVVVNGAIVMMPYFT